MKYYKHLLAFISFVFLLLACNETTTKNSKVDSLTKSSDTSVKVKQEVKNTIDTYGNTLNNSIWVIDFEAKTKRKIVENVKKNINEDSIIASLNSRYTGIPLKKVKKSGDTLYLNIPDSHILTQKMGSSGAAQYLAETIINLTSIKGINFIRLDFEEGDHAGPGIWSKKDYTDVNEIK